MINIHEIETYVITLDKNGERMKRYMHSAQRSNLFPNIWQGLNGKKWKLKTGYAHINESMIGNALANITLLDQQQHKAGWTFITEDDVYFIDGFHDKLVEAISDLPEADIYFLGWCPFTYDAEKYPYHQWPLNDKWSGVSVFHGTYGYLVRNNNIPKILDALPELWHNIDWMYYGAQKDKKLQLAFLNDRIVIHDWEFGSMLQTEQRGKKG